MWSYWAPCSAMGFSLFSSPPPVARRGSAWEWSRRQGNPPPRRGCLLPCRLDILVVPEQIRRVVLPFQLRQTRIVSAVGRPDLVCPVVVSAVVDVDPTRG